MVVADIKKHPLKKSPGISMRKVSTIRVYKDRLEFNHRGKRLVTRDPRLLYKALAIMAEVYLS